MKQIPEDDQIGHGQVGPQAGEHYAELIREQLEEERSRKASLEQRALGVVPISGLLATVLLFVASSSLGPDSKLEFQSEVKWGTGLALLLFMIAVLLALVANRTRGYDEPKLDYLERLTEEQFWTGRSQVGSRTLAQARLGILKAAREKNDRKALWLALALGCEVAAIVSVIVTGGFFLAAL